MLSLFLTFLKMGTFIFGSGHALAQAMQKEIVDKQEWLSPEQFQDGWAVGNALPGPIAPKVVVYTGYEVAGVLGAAVAVTAYLLPSAAGMTALAAALMYQGGGEGFVGKLVTGLKSAVKGIKPAVLAILLEAFLGYTGVTFPKGQNLWSHLLPLCAVAVGAVLLLVGMRMMSGKEDYLLSDWRALAVFALSFIAMAALGWNTIYVVLGAAAVGLSYLIWSEPRVVS